MTHSHVSVIVVSKINSTQQQLRERIVQFYENHNEKGTQFACLHFLDEGVPKSTIYSILSTLRVERQACSGRKATIMTKKNLRC